MVLAGPIGTGKTCFCVRVHEGLFKATYKPTISPDYSSVRRAVPGGGGMATVQLWDTSGEPEQIKTPQKLGGAAGPRCP